MTDLRRRYFETLALPDYPPSKPPPPSLVDALDRAHELRKFEIEHYWKRAQYFWGFQVAIFAAFGLLWKESTASPWQPLAFALAALGLLTAIANTLSAAGSKFWQNNWEYHIDLLEDRVEGRLHKTVWMPKGRMGYLVSGVNQTLGWCFVAFWLTASAYTAWKICGGHLFPLDQIRARPDLRRRDRHHDRHRAYRPVSTNDWVGSIVPGGKW